MSSFTAKLEAEKYTVYCNTEVEASSTKKVSKALVDCKVILDPSDKSIGCLPHRPSFYFCNCVTGTKGIMTFGFIDSVMQF